MSEQNRSDRVAWLRSVLDEFEGRLLGYAARITGDADTARDVVQETILRLCGQRPESLNGRVPQWLFAVCRNLAIDARKKGGRMAMMSDVTAILEPPAEAVTADPVAIAEAREGSAHALALLARLPANQQEVIRLRLSAGLSYKEIAEVTGQSVSNVGFLMHTGLKTLREKMIRAGSASDRKRLED